MWSGHQRRAACLINNVVSTWAELARGPVAIIPIPPEAGAFHRVGGATTRQYFQYYDEPPKHLKVYGASDYAVSEDHGDYTVHLVVGVAPNDDIYLLDLWREQANTLTWVETLFALVDKYRDQLHVWGEEKDQIEKGVGPFINKLCQERNRYFTRYELPTTGNKELKARSIQARMQQKRIWFPRKAPWLAAFESELLQFPAGVHDDQVDALANIGRILDRMGKGQIPQADRPPAWAMQGRGSNRIRLDFGAIDKDLNIHR